jgi:hypothetical protein
MAYFAQLDDAFVVLRVIAVNNDTIGNLPFPESEPIGIAFLQTTLGDGMIWKQASYNGNFRKNYAGVGYTYYPALDAFIPPSPFPSWVLNTGTCQWKAPIPKPNDEKKYRWDEATLSWVEVPATTP